MVRGEINPEAADWGVCVPNSASLDTFGFDMAKISWLMPLSDTSELEGEADPTNLRSPLCLDSKSRDVGLKERRVIKSRCSVASQMTPRIPV
jgi:hypothetical protein